MSLPGHINQFFLPVIHKMVFAMSMNQLAKAETGKFWRSLLLLLINVKFESVCDRCMLVTVAYPEIWNAVGNPLFCGKIPSKYIIGISRLLYKMQES
jgi:hypothetical protein